MKTTLSLTRMKTIRIITSVVACIIGGCITFSIEYEKARLTFDNEGNATLGYRDGKASIEAGFKLPKKNQGFKK